jgi:hypothetical protein
VYGAARVGVITCAVLALGGTSAGASTTPVSVPQMFVQHDHVDPLVIRHAGGLTSAAPGIATVSTGTGEVLVAVDLTFGAADRASGAVIGGGPSGGIIVLVEDDGGDQRVSVHLTDGVGGDTVLDSAPAAAPGLPASAHLRVEQHSGRMRAWLDGVLVIDRPLTGPEVVLMTQDDHGTVVERASDEVTAAWVLARG